MAEQLSDVKEIPCTAAKIENAFRPRQVELDLADPADVNINPSFEIEKFGPVQAGTFDTVTLANLPETLSIDRFDDSLRFQRKAVRPKESLKVFQPRLKPIRAIITPMTAAARRSESTSLEVALAFLSLGTRWAVSSHCDAMPFHSSNEG